MSAYDKLAACLFNFKCKALEREEEGKEKKNMMENWVKESAREQDADIFLARGETDTSDAGC